MWMHSLSVNSFGIVILILSLVSATHCQHHAVGRPLGPAGLTRIAREVKTCQPGDMGPKCADCNTLLTCVGSQMFASQPCSSLNTQTPYCVNDACASTTTQICVSKSFKCTGTGQFPDPHDCTRYFLCDKAGGKAYAYECPAQFVYDSKSGLCKRTSCRTIDCSNTPNQYVVYSADPSILAYCLNSATEKQVILFRCADQKSMQYDQKSLKCVYQCSSEGRFADKLDCHSFYECYRSGRVFTWKRQTCPKGYSYEQVRQICVRQASCRNEIGDVDDGESGDGTDMLLYY